MKRIFLLLFFFWPPLLLAQFTQVSGTVKDPNGLPYANGTITATLVISGSPTFASSGFGYSPPTQPVGLDATGSFVMQLADVTQINPPGGTWSFTVCSAAGTVQPGSPITNGPVCFTAPGFIISGTAVNISSQLSLAAPALTAPGLGGTPTLANPLVIPQRTSALPVPGTGNTGFGTQFATACCAQNVPSMWAPALNSATYSWQPISYIAVNTLAPANVNGQNFIGPTSPTPPPAPTNGINVSWTRTAPTGASLQRQDISAAIVGDGVATDCFIGTGSFSPCPNGVGAGVAGQFPIYNGTNSIVGTPNLVDGTATPGFLTAIEPVNVTTTGKTLGLYGQTPTGPTSPFTYLTAGGSGNSAGTVPFFSGSNSATTAGNAGINVPIPTIQINGTNPSLSVQNFNATTPAAPANGINVTWNRVSTGITGAIVGDGNVNDCFLGTGVFGPCNAAGRTQVATCSSTNGACSVLFTTPFTSIPTCVTSPAQTGTTSVTSFNINTNQTTSTTVSVNYVPTTVSATFNFICTGT